MSIKTAQRLAVALGTIAATTGLRVLVIDDDAEFCQSPKELQPPLTHCDEERMRKAEAKRERKAAKRKRQEGGQA